MKTTNKNHPVYKYILDAIDGSNYDKTLTTDEEKLKFCLDTFRAEYGWAIKQYGEPRAFAKWLIGLPSAIYIDIENKRIIEIAHAWKSLPENATASLKDRIIENWFNFIAVKFFQLCRRYKVS